MRRWKIQGGKWRWSEEHKKDDELIKGEREKEKERSLHRKRGENKKEKDQGESAKLSRLSEIKRSRPGIIMTILQFYIFGWKREGDFHRTQKRNEKKKKKLRRIRTLFVSFLSLFHVLLLLSIEQGGRGGMVRVGKWTHKWYEGGRLLSFYFFHFFFFFGDYYFSQAFLKKHVPFLRNPEQK